MAMSGFRVAPRTHLVLSYILGMQKVTTMQEANSLLTSVDFLAPQVHDRHHFWYATTIPDARFVVAQGTTHNLALHLATTPSGCEGRTAAQGTTPHNTHLFTIFQDSALATTSPTPSRCDGRWLQQRGWPMQCHTMMLKTLCTLSRYNGRWWHNKGSGTAMPQTPLVNNADIANTFQLCIKKVGKGWWREDLFYFLTHQIFT